MIRTSWSKARWSPASRCARGAAYVYIRGEYIREAEVLQAAIHQAYDAG